MAGTALSLAERVTKPKPKVPLVRIGTRFFREIEVGKGDEKQVVLVPVDVELNLDPLEVAKAAAVAGVVAVVGGVAAWLVWDGLALPSPAGPIQVWRGLKEVPFWSDQAKRAAARWEDKQAGVPDLTKASKATDVSQIDCGAARIFYSGLSDFTRGFCRRNGLNSEECLEAWRELQERCDL